MDMIRNNNDGKEFKIYGTHPNKDTVYFRYCDEWEIEPELSGEKYIQYCLDFCKRNNIEVFIPRKENVRISKDISRFEEIGVKVLVCPDKDLISMMDNKVAMYESLENKKDEKGLSIVTVPEYRVVTDAEGFKKAYNELITKGMSVCIKPVVGEGAVGFRIIDNQVETLRYLLNTSGSQRISYNQLISILESEDNFPELMVLEYLEGTEYSIDCLADSEGNLVVAIPRKKGSGRVRLLEDNKELLEVAQKMASEYKIPFVYNIQVRFSKGVPKLLEINPRMSGGLHISCLAGVNIPYLALSYLLEIPTEDNIKPKFGVRATNLEMPILINED
jgi:biotin carboxylase